MAETKQETTATEKEKVITTPAQEPDINEVDGEPIFHDQGEDGDGDE